MWSCGGRVIAFLLFSAPALADEITLTSGGRLRGRIVGDTGARVTVDVGSGTVTLERGQIASIQITPMAQDEFEGRLAATPETAEGFAELGAWAQRRGLGTRAREMFEKALAKDTDHAQARRELGFVRRDGAWTTRALSATAAERALAERAGLERDLKMLERPPRRPSIREPRREERLPLGLQPPPERPPRYVGGGRVIIVMGSP